MVGGRLLLGLLLLPIVSEEVEALRCYVGLGNSSARHRQKVHTCPAEEGYVCIKMFGGGMGDRIRRKCDKIEPHEYETLLEHEREKAAALASGEPLATDPACKETKHNGREVILCLCSTEKCNNQPNIQPLLLLILLSSSAQLLF